VKLRTTLTVVMTGVGALAVAVSISLMFVTSSLYESGLRLARTTEHVRLVMDLESYALQHLRGAGNGELQAAIDTLERLRETSGADARQDIERLDRMMRSFAMAATPAEQASKFDAFVGDLRGAVARQDQDSRRALADAASWNRLANITGLVVVIVLLVGVAGVLAWLWRSALQPLVTVVEAIGRFASGDATVRAPEEGPAEIREVATAFNDMAVSLARQREQQLAFIGGVAHDLRTPLNTLHVAISILDQPPSEAGRVRERIRRQVQRLERMIGDLLDRTRIEAGQLDLHREECDLRDLLARVVDAQRDAEPDRMFRLRLPHDRVPVRCDALRIEQVVTNLLTNAVKYSPASSDVEIALACDESLAVLSVTDHGIGMTAGDRSRVFEPFRRGQNAGNIAGIGLGLSVARKIVEAHGGTIAVRSEPGSGSTFSVSVPLASGAPIDSARSATKGESAALFAG
jgi:two-component system sensor histidine kinase MtrB